MNLTRRSALWLIGGTFARLAIPAPVFVRPAIVTPEYFTNAIQTASADVLLHPVAVKMWARKLFQEAMRESVLNKFPYANMDLLPVERRA